MVISVNNNACENIVRDIKVPWYYRSVEIKSGNVFHNVTIFLLISQPQQLQLAGYEISKNVSIAGLAAELPSFWEGALSWPHALLFSSFRSLPLLPSISTDLPYIFRTENRTVFNVNTAIYTGDRCARNYINICDVTLQDIMFLNNARYYAIPTHGVENRNFGVQLL